MSDKPFNLDQALAASVPRCTGCGAGLDIKHGYLCSKCGSKVLRDTTAFFRQVMHQPLSEEQKQAVVEAVNRRLGDVFPEKYGSD